MPAIVVRGTEKEKEPPVGKYAHNVLVSFPVVIYRDEINLCALRNRVNDVCQQAADDEAYSFFDHPRESEMNSIVLLRPPPPPL